MHDLLGLPNLSPRPIWSSLFNALSTRSNSFLNSKIFILYKTISRHDHLLQNTIKMASPRKSHLGFLCSCPRQIQTLSTYVSAHGRFHLFIIFKCIQLTVSFFLVSHRTNTHTGHRPIKDQASCPSGRDECCSRPKVSRCCNKCWGVGCHRWRWIYAGNA